MPRMIEDRAGRDPTSHSPCRGRGKYGPNVDTPLVFVRAIIALWHAVPGVTARTQHHRH